MDQNPANLEQPVNEQNNEQAPAPPKKKVRQTFTLKPEHFQKQNGLQALYKSISEVDLTNGTDNVQLTMKKLTGVLKKWNYQMAPRYNFDYFLQRCKALGNHKFTQAYMTKVRRIHKAQDSWGSEVPQSTDPLNNVDLNHLNPNQQQHFLPSQTLQKKIENAMKLVNDIENRQFKQQHIQSFSEKMEIQKQSNNRSQDQHQYDEQDQCDMLLKQMDELQRQKKKLFSKSKEESKIQQNSQVKKSTPQQENQQEVPYVPQGFQDMDYGQYSSQNY